MLSGGQPPVNPARRLAMSRMRDWTRSIAPLVAAVGAALAGMAPIAGAQPLSETPQDLQRALQRRYDLVRDFTADFTHTYRGGLLTTTLVERGTVHVKKPGRMRWDYREPERKLYLSDGQYLYSYLPEDRQVRVGELPGGGEATTPALFLAGRGSFATDFTAAFDAVDDPPPNSRVLRLTPRRAERDFEFLIVVIDAPSLAIVRLVAYDLQGGVSTFFFSNLRENVGLSDRPFTFDIPRDTDVIDTTASGTFRQESAP
jgi:outer membrane lipoprotein carrier protein